MLSGIAFFDLCGMGREIRERRKEKETPHPPFCGQNGPPSPIADAGEGRRVKKWGAREGKVG